LGQSAIWLISAWPNLPNYVPGSASLARGQTKPTQLAPLNGMWFHKGFIIVKADSRREK
jgi:hypothetical protein